MTRILAAAAAAALLVGAAQAQTVTSTTTKTTAPAAPVVKTTKTTSTVTHTAASLDCSKQADAKGLHGKARKEFRSSCKAAAKAH